MKKTHKVVMLPTEKAISQGQLIIIDFKDKNKPQLFTASDQANDIATDTGNIVGQHLYIISEDEIKEGDLCLFFWDGGELGSDKPQQYQPSKGHVLNNGLKKIVATTDKSITKDIATSGKFYEPLPQIPESFIQAYIKAYNEGKPITEVDLEMEENTKFKKPLASVYNSTRAILNNLDTTYTIKTRPDNTVIVHQSKMYSRDELLKAFNEAYSMGYSNGLLYDMADQQKEFNPDKWIQDNL